MRIEDLRRPFVPPPSMSPRPPIIGISICLALSERIERGTPQVGREFWSNSNVPMVVSSAVPGPPNKRPNAQRILERLVIQHRAPGTERARSITAEILHRYSAINRRQDIQIAFDAVLRVVDEVLPVDRSAAERAKQIVLSYHRICRPAMLCMSQSSSDANQAHLEFRYRLRWAAWSYPAGLRVQRLYSAARLSLRHHEFLL